jgi:hypothetical protein
VHVPEKFLPQYRARKAIADKYDALGNALSNIRAYPEANQAWKQRAKWNAWAQELRVAGREEASAEA